MGLFPSKEFYKISQVETDRSTAVNHTLLLILLIHATCFGRIDHPQAFKHMNLKTQNKMHIYFKFVKSQKYFNS